MVMEGIEINNNEIDEILRLCRQATADRTTTFDILDKEGDERTHTQFLRWMFDPLGSHGLGATFLNKCLDTATGTEYSVEEVDESAVKSVVTFNQEPDDTELDIRIETNKRLVAFEIKTQSPLRAKQINNQTRYLQEQVEKEIVDSWDYVLLTQAHQNPKYPHPQLRWNDIYRRLATLVGQVDSDIDTLRIRDWMRAIDKDLIKQQDFGPESKLVLRYEEKLDELGIPYDSNAYIDDRIQLFKRVREWLREQYELSSESADDWTSGTLPSRFEQGSDIYRIGKRQWENVGIRFEILATDKRLKHGTDHNANEGYRSTDSLIEVTLRHKISKHDARSSPENPTASSQQRDRLHEKLVQEGHWEALQEVGFRRTRTLLAEDQPLNRHHMYSREVPLFEQDGKGVFAAVREAVEALMNTQTSINEFVEAELAR